MLAMGIGKTLGTIGGIAGSAGILAAGAPTMASAVTGIFGTGSLATSVAGGLTSAHAAIAGIGFAGIGSTVASASTWLTGLTAATPVYVTATPTFIYGGLSGMLATAGITGAAATVGAAALLTVGVVAAAVIANKVINSIGDHVEKASDNAQRKIETQRVQQRQQQRVREQQKQREQELKREAALAKQRANYERQNQKHYKEIADNYGQVQQEQQKTHTARIDAEKAKNQTNALSHADNVVQRRKAAPDVMTQMPFV